MWLKTTMESSKSSLVKMQSKMNSPKLLDRSVNWHNYFGKLFVSV